MCHDCLPGGHLTRRGSIRLGATAFAALAMPRLALNGHRTHAGTTAPDVLPRAAWADGRPPLAAPSPEDVRFLLVHHTAGQTEHSEQSALDQMRLAYDFHTSPVKGWSDVAYNFFIDRFGRVFEGRAGSLDGPVVADATGGSQGFAQLVCLLGDFTSVMPSDAALESLAQTLAWLADRNGLDTTPGATVDFVSRGSNRWSAGDVVSAATISSHRDMSQTACPGDTFHPFVRDQLSVIVHGLREPPPATSPATSPSTSSSSPDTTTETTPQPTTTTPSGTEPSPNTSVSASASAVPDAPRNGDDAAADPPELSAELATGTPVEPTDDSSSASRDASNWLIGAGAALFAGLGVYRMRMYRRSELRRRDTQVTIGPPDRRGTRRKKESTDDMGT